jgi:hypothetical protein
MDYILRAKQLLKDEDLEQHVLDVDKSSKHLQLSVLALVIKLGDRLKRVESVLTRMASTKLSSDSDTSTCEDTSSCEDTIGDDDSIGTCTVDSLAAEDFDSSSEEDILRLAALQHALS